MGSYHQDQNGFEYSYNFEHDFGWHIQVNVDYTFQSLSDLERISHFPHGQRRVFALNIIQKYAPGVYHTLPNSDICNSFARRLVDLFKTPLQIYWVRRPRDTVLIISGLGYSSTSSAWINYSATVCRIVPT